MLLSIGLISCQKQEILTKEVIIKEYRLFKSRNFNLTDLLKINEDLFLNPKIDNQSVEINQMLSYLKAKYRDASIYTRIIEFNKKPIIFFRLQFIGSNFSDDYLDIGFCLVQDEKLLNNTIFQSADNPALVNGKGIGLFKIEKGWYGFFHY